MTKGSNSLSENHAIKENNMDAYMERNNGFQVISWDCWIKHLGNRNYQVIAITRPEYDIQKGWVNFFHIDVNDFTEDTISKAWDDEEDVKYSSEIVTKDKLTSELLVKHHYATINEQTAFEGDKQLQSIMRKYGIVDNLEV